MAFVVEIIFSNCRLSLFLVGVGVASSCIVAFWVKQYNVFCYSVSIKLFLYYHYTIVVVVFR